MNGSYLNHSKDTKEFAEGQLAKLDESFNIQPSVNPYPSATKEWLDWELGYDSCEAETINQNAIENIAPADLFVNPFLVREYYDTYGFRI